MPADSLSAYEATFLCLPPFAGIRVGITMRTDRDLFDWRRLVMRGIETSTGHSDPLSALVQILMFPVLALLWAIAITLICALVG